MPAAADIIGISAPSSAPVGETVIVDVSVKNISGVDRYIAVTGVFDSTNLTWQFDYLLVSPGQTVVMRGWFTMPSKSVRVTAWGWYWDGSKWVQDDTGYVDIALTVLAPEFSGFAIAEYNRV
jgi:hypothetical protein